GAMLWPPLNDLIADVVSLHTGRPTVEIASLLDQYEGRSVPPAFTAHEERDTALPDPALPADNEHGLAPEAG
ncbi:hypothetical protein ACFYMW_34005, partial [Streptomyces sp. NPDC006692]